MTPDDILRHWLNDPGEAVTLPSGKPYRLRHVDLLALVDDNGEIPNLLRGMVDAQRGDAPPDDDESALSQQLLAAQPFLNRLALACVVSPPIVTDASEYETREGVWLHQIPLVDKMALVAWALGGTAAIAQTVTFPERDGLAATDLDAASASDDVGPSAE